MNKRDLEDKSCTCHISPPCEYCIDSSILEVIENCDENCGECQVFNYCEKEEKIY
jgi:hypothetical protein